MLVVCQLTTSLRKSSALPVPALQVMWLAKEKTLRVIFKNCEHFCTPWQMTNRTCKEEEVERERERERDEDREHQEHAARTLHTLCNPGRALLATKMIHVHAFGSLNSVGVNTTSVTTISWSLMHKMVHRWERMKLASLFCRGVRKTLWCIPWCLLACLFVQGWQPSTSLAHLSLVAADGEKLANYIESNCFTVD